MNKLKECVDIVEVEKVYHWLPGIARTDPLLVLEFLQKVRPAVASSPAIVLEDGNNLEPGEKLGFACVFRLDTLALVLLQLCLSSACMASVSL